MNDKIGRGGPWRVRLHHWGAALLQQLLPGACALCGGACDDALCAACAEQFFGPAAALARCPRCANPLPGAAADSAGDSAAPLLPPGVALSSQPVPDRLAQPVSNRLARPSRPDGQLCGVCLADPPAFDRTLVAADYAMPLDQLVLQLKFGHRLALAPLCARLLRDALLRQPDFTLPALLCAVPLGPRRLAERGYNQALEIARPLARQIGVRLEAQLLQRVHDTAAQSSVAPERRQQNIAGAFSVTDAALVAGRHIGVVDDVMTSGRTLNELAATLKRHGAARVSNLVFARTPPH